MGTAIKHSVPDRVKPSFVIFDIQALWRSGLSVRVSHGVPKISKHPASLWCRSGFSLKYILYVLWKQSDSIFS